MDSFPAITSDKATLVLCTDDEGDEGLVLAVFCCVEDLYMATTPSALESEEQDAA
jgi:hypothetical protein